MSSSSRSHPIMALLTSRDSRTRVLPPDLLADVARRLSIAALAMAISFAIALPIMHYVQSTGIRPERPGSRLMVGIALLLSLAVYRLARTSRLSAERLISLGLAYEVLLSFMISMLERFGPYPGGGQLREVSFVCVIIVLFPVLVPATPFRTFVTATTAALMGPLAYALSLMVGYAPRPLADVVLPFAYSFICAGLAITPALVITRLVKGVTAARELGSYKLEALLGRGGMGEVWRGQHMLLARPTAIKLISAEALGGSEFDVSAVHRRFRREAQATARLRSQHTVALYDYGLTDDGTFYYAMEMLDGLDVESLVSRYGALPPGRAVHLLRQACLSLDEAHGAGLVHRDIKPANMFVCRQGGEADLLKLLDFGLVTEVDSSRATNMTDMDCVVGTPACIAPEQARGQEVGPQADIYGLGCVAYWMLSGHQVFPGRNVPMTIMAHLCETPVPLRESVGEAIPSDLDAIVMQCLSKDPADRPGSARALRDRLSDCVCASQWTEADAARWWQSYVADGDPVPAADGTPNLVSKVIDAPEGVAAAVLQTVRRDAFGAD